MKSPSAVAREASSENSPLLSPSAERDDAFESHAHDRRPAWQTARMITNLIFAVVLLASLGDRIQESPQFRINEAVICYNHFERSDPTKLLLDRNHVGPGAIGGVAESDCKVDAVQNSLVMLNGWAQLFDCIPMLFIAIPLGWVADRFGRKPVLLLSFGAMVAKIVWVQAVTWFWQRFDIRLTWLSSLPLLVGGGPTTLSSMIFTALSDVTPENKRAGAFLRVGAFNLGAGLVMPPLASWLMEINPWIPAIAGTGMVFISVIALVFIPETLDFQRSSSAYRVIVVESEPTSDDYIPRHQRTWRQSFRRNFTCIQSTTAFLTDDWRVPALMVPFIGHVVIAIMGPLTLQYLSKRYHISVAKATLLNTIRSAVITAVFFIILPLLSTLLERRLHLSGQRKDLYLARASQVITAVGWIFIGLAPTVPLVAASLFFASLGQGAATLIRSFMISLTPAHRVARTFVVLGVMETVGIMAGAPVLAALFKRGVEMGGLWAGLPFVSIGGLTALLGVILFVTRIRPGEDEAHFAREEEQR